jgi:hypothetical protein
MNIYDLSSTIQTTKMATITIKKTKLGNRLVLLEKQYELIPELWEEVLSYFNESIEKHLIKLGIPKLHDMFKSVFKVRITNITNSNIAIEKRRALLMGRLMKYHHKGNSLFEYLPKKPERKKPAPKDWSGHHVGLMVRWYESKEWGRRRYVYGRITAVNEKSVTAMRYLHIKINDEYALRNQTIGTDKIELDIPSGQKKVFLSPISRYDRHPEEKDGDGIWSERCDWGN